MAEVRRAEELVQTMEPEPAIREEVEAAPMVAAKRAAVDAHGFQDGTLVLPPQAWELSDQEPDAVVGGDEMNYIPYGVIGVRVAVAAAG